MSFDFKLPDIGEGVTEGEVVKWLVKEGDEVEEDQAILEIMTDKATVEISAPQKAKIESFHAKAGDVVPVGNKLVTFSGQSESSSHLEDDEDSDSDSDDEKSKKKSAKQDEDDDEEASEKRSQKKKKDDEDEETDQSEKKSSKKASTPSHPATEREMPRAARSSSSPQPMSMDSQGRVLASPATRRLAREMGLDITRIQGTGPGGRITREDLMTGNGAVQAGAPVAYVPREIVTTQSKSKKKKPEFGRREPGPYKSGEETVPLRGIRKAISERMLESKRNAAHFTHVDEVDMTELVELRKTSKEKAAEKGVKLSYLPFIIRAITMGLKEFPSLNATLDQEKKEITYKYYYNIGIAVATNTGDLVVPTIKDADQKSIMDLGSEIQSIAEKARQGKLSMDDLSGGTFTLTSMGNLGGLFATPIINYPEVAILGFHQIKETPVVRDGEIVIRQMAHLSISLDHRLVDGAVGASFLNEVIQYLENPSSMLLNS